ncbi:hypothetical protein [Metabacillus fastidiosus]|uniref:hypothetical protein n=1 Tax=Metabacillus fastidiosus TaxID=1458 RepID=UPI003D29F954
MIIKATRGEDFAFIDNEGEVLHQVKISGNNYKLIESLEEILNARVEIRFGGEMKGLPDDLIVRESGQPPKINKASNNYIANHFVNALKLQEFNVEIIQE